MASVSQDEGRRGPRHVEEGDHLTRSKAVKKATKRAAASSTFATVAASWVKSEGRRAHWTPDYKEEVASSIKNHPSALDGLPVDEIIAAIAVSPPPLT